MKKKFPTKIKVVIALLATFHFATAYSTDPDPVMLKGDIQLKSLTSIAFNKDGVLFLADPLGSKICAVDEKQGAPSPSANLEILNIDEKLAAVLGVSTKDIKIEDMAVNPTSKEVYFAVTRRGSDLQPTVVKVNKDSKLSLVNLDNVSYYQTSLNDVPSKSPSTYFPLTSAITDMEFIDGELYVSGLSGEEFSSKLRRIPYPFTNKTTAVQLEIFHPSHDRFETHAPIETFLPFSVNGKMHIIAGYGCAPLAKFPLTEIRAKDQLRGVTVAELGGGNRPLDMISFKDGSVDYLLIANSDRTLMQISSEDLDKQQAVVKGPTRVMPYASVGVEYLSIAEIGITQLDDLDDQSYVVVQRSMDDGSLNLRSKGKLKPTMFRVRVLVEELRLSGKLAEAESEIIKYESDGDRGAVSVMYYNLACSYALANKSDGAFKYLDKALSFGYNSKQQYENDTDLVSIRNDTRWKSLLNKLE